MSSEKKMPPDLLGMAKDLSSSQMDTDKAVEYISSKPLRDMEVEDQIKALIETNDKLIEVVTKVPELAKTTPNFYSTNKSRPLTSPSKEAMETTIKKQKAAITVQSWWKMLEAKKKLQKTQTESMTNTKKPLSANTEKELLGIFNLFLKNKNQDWETFYAMCESEEEEMKEANSVSLANGGSSIGFSKRIIYIKQFSDTVLGTLRLPMTVAQVQKLIKIFDEDSVGVITYDNYCQALEGYGYSTEKYRSGHISYGQECMAKLVGILKRREIEPGAFFTTCMGSGAKAGTKITEKMFVDGVTALNAGLLKREISCLSSYLDPRHVGQISKDEFLLLCKSGEAYLKILNTKASMDAAKSVVMKDKASEIEKQVQEIVQKMATSGVPIDNFCKILSGKEISAKLLKEKLAAVYPVLSQEEIAAIVNGSPSSNGVIQIKAFEEYINKNNATDANKPVNAHFESWVQAIESSGQSIAEYFRKKGVTAASTIGYTAFCAMAKESMPSCPEGSLYLMFKSFLSNYQNFSGVLVSPEAIFSNPENFQIKGNDLLAVLESYRHPIPAPNTRLPYSNNSVVLKMTYQEKSYFIGGPSSESDKQLGAIAAKLANGDFTYGVAMEQVSWSKEGMAKAAEIERALSDVMGNILTPEEIKCIFMRLSTGPTGKEPKQSNVSIAKALEVYENYFESVIDDSRIIRLDLMVIAVDIQKRGGQSIEEYFNNKKLYKRAKVTRERFVEFIKGNYNLSDKSALRIASEISKQNPTEQSTISIESLIKIMGEFLNIQKQDLEKQSLGKNVEAILKEIGIKITLLRKISIPEYFSKLYPGKLDEDINATREQLSLLAKDLSLTAIERECLLEYFHIPAITPMSGTPQKITLKSIATQIESLSVSHMQLSGVQLENEAIKIMDEIDTTLLPTLAECFGMIPLKAGGALALDLQDGMLNWLMEKYATIAISKLVVVLLLIQERCKDREAMAVDLQNLLREFTISKKPSVALEIKQMLWKQGVMEGDITLEALLNKCGISVSAEPLSLADFISKAALPLSLDEQAAELIFWKLQQKKAVTIPAFKAYISGFINIIPKPKPQPQPQPQLQPQIKPAKKQAEPNQDDVLNIVSAKSIIIANPAAEEKKDIKAPTPLDKSLSPHYKEQKKDSPKSLFSTPYPGDDKFNAAEFVSKLEEITQIPLKSVLDQMMFNEEGCTSTNLCTSILKKLFPACDVQYMRSLGRKLDPERKGTIAFCAMMDFLTNNSTLSKFAADEQEECKAIAKALNTQFHTMKTYLKQVVSLQPGDKITIPVFVKLIMTLLPNKAISDIYYLFYKLAGPSCYIPATTLINTIEPIRCSGFSQSVQYPPALKSGLNKLIIFFNSQNDNVDPIKCQEIHGNFSSDMKNTELLKATLTKADFMRKLPVATGIAFTEDELKLLSEFADKRKEDAIVVSDFIEMVPEQLFEDINPPEEAKAGKGKRPENPELKSGLEKVRKFHQRCIKAGDEFEVEFMMADNDNDGKLIKEAFEECLRKMDAGLNENEIKALAESVPYDADNLVPFETFVKLVQSEKQASEIEMSKEEKKGEVVDEPPKILSPDIIRPDLAVEAEELGEIMKGNLEKLQKETNFGKLPLEEIATKIDFPYPEFKVNIEDNFPIMDPMTKKRRVTIVRSAKAALLAAELIFNSLKKHERYVDAEFGPNESDPHGRMSIYHTGEPPDHRCVNPEEIIWLRPHEINPNAKFMDIEGMNACDVAQGELGDCWFLSALSIVASGSSEYLMGHLNKSVLEFIDTDKDPNQQIWNAVHHGVFPSIFHYYTRKGIYIMRFTKDFDHYYVITDDKLPCRQDKQLVFARSKSGEEFWVPLIEKAYAKLHGDFFSLTSGFIDEALNDLTGHPPNKLKMDSLKDEKTPSREAIDGWWNMMMESSYCLMMGCSVAGKTEGQVWYEGNPTGIMSGHAYPILDVLMIGKDTGKMKSRLLRLRNPWGQTEWIGKWADSSEKMKQGKERILQHYNSVVQEYESKKIHLHNLEKFEGKEEDDGVFFMCYYDWREIFTSLYVCGDFLTLKKLEGDIFAYCWNEDNAGGTPIHGTEEEGESWAKNPYARITISDAAEADIMIYVFQKDPRMIPGAEFPYEGHILSFCFSILEVTPGEVLEQWDPSKVRFVSPIANQRQMTTIQKLKGGTEYLVVPSTKEPGKVGNFWLGVFYPKARKDKITVTFCASNVEKMHRPKATAGSEELIEEPLREFYQRRKTSFLYAQQIDAQSESAINRSKIEPGNKEEKKGD